MTDSALAAWLTNPHVRPAEHPLHRPGELPCRVCGIRRPGCEASGCPTRLPERLVPRWPVSGPPPTLPLPEPGMGHGGQSDPAAADGARPEAAPRPATDPLQPRAEEAPAISLANDPQLGRQPRVTRFDELPSGGGPAPVTPRPGAGVGEHAQSGPPVVAQRVEGPRTHHPIPAAGGASSGASRGTPPPPAPAGPAVEPRAGSGRADFHSETPSAGTGKPGPNRQDPTRHGVFRALGGAISPDGGCLDRKMPGAAFDGDHAGTAPPRSHLHGGDFLDRLMVCPSWSGRRLDPEEELSLWVAAELRRLTRAGRLRAVWSRLPAEIRRGGQRAAMWQCLGRVLGVIKGASDFVLTWGEGSLWLELKIERAQADLLKPGRRRTYLRPEQRDFRDWCLSLGVGHAIVRSVPDLHRALRDAGRLV